MSDSRYQVITTLFRSDEIARIEKLKRLPSKETIVIKGLKILQEINDEKTTLDEGRIMFKTINQVFETSFAVAYHLNLKKIKKHQSDILSMFHSLTEEGHPIPLHLLEQSDANLEIHPYKYLYAACESGDINFINFFAELGFDFNSKDGMVACLPVCTAAIHNQYEIVEYMVEWGADLNPTNQSQSLLATFLNEYPKNLNIIDALNMTQYLASLGARDEQKISKLSSCFRKAYDSGKKFSDKINNEIRDKLNPWISIKDLQTIILAYKGLSCPVQMVWKEAGHPKLPIQSYRLFNGKIVNNGPKIDLEVQHLAKRFHLWAQGTPQSSDQEKLLDWIQSKDNKEEFMKHYEPYFNLAICLSGKKYGYETNPPVPEDEFNLIIKGIPSSRLTRK